MSELIRHLRNTGTVDPQQLDAAFRRQQIYGGSLDTVLLELSYVTPARMDELLALACGLPPVPAHMFDPRVRPWESLPKELVDLGWVMPLDVVDGKLHAAVHPELGDDKLAQLRRSVPGVVPMVTAECCLARLASERTGSVIPQRYAVLAMSYVDELRRSGDGESDVGLGDATPAPWMSSPALERPSTLGPDTVPPPTTEAPSVETTQEMPRFRAPRREQDAPAPRDEERTRAIAQPPPVRNPNVEAPLPAPPPYQESPWRPKTEHNLPSLVPREPEPSPERSTMEGAATISSEIASPPAPTPAPTDPPTLTGATRQADVPVAAAFREQFGAAKAEVANARDRDAVTSALARACMLISPRVALFGIKKEGLRGLETPTAISGIDGTVTPISALIENALEAGPVRDRASDLDLRLTVGQESAVPCLLAPVCVRDRPVLLVYMDRDGAEFTDDDVERVKELTRAANHGLEAVLKLLASKRAGPETARPAPDPPPEPADTRRPPPGKPARAHATLEMPNLIGGREGAPRLPNLVEPELPVRFTTLVGQGPGPDLGSAASTASSASGSPASADSQARTLPGLDPSPTADQTTPAGDAHSIWNTPSAPPTPAGESVNKIITLTSAPPPPASPGITPLAAPINPQTTRGQLVFEEEEATEVSRVPPSDSMEARIDACLQSALGGGATVGEVMGFGERALLRIAARFPGPIDVFRRDLDTLAPPAAHGALIRLAIQIGEPIVPHLVELMDHRSPNVRFYAAFVFQALRDDRCIKALAERAFDSDTDVRAIAMRVLETYSRSPDFSAAAAHVRAELTSENRTKQLHAARGLGTLRDTDSVATMIELLSNKDRYIQEAALESLCSITGQQLGLKPHRWRKWYADNGARHRVEWIMSSLQHRDVAVRRWAADELRRVTGQDIDFPATGEQTLRDASLRRWMEWWHNQGRAQFGA